VWCLWQSFFIAQTCDLPQWFLEKIKKNKEMWIYWHHENLFSLFTQRFWDELTILSKTVNFRIVIVCSSFTFANKSNEEITKCFPQLLIDSGVMQLFRSVSYQIKENDMFISGCNLVITQVDDAQKGGAITNDTWNLAARKTLSNRMCSAIVIK